MKYLYGFIFFMSGIVSLTAQQTGFDYTYHNDTFSTRPYYYTQFNGVEISDTAYYVIGTGLDSSYTHSLFTPPWYQTGIFMQIDTNGRIISNRIFRGDSSEVRIKFNPMLKTNDNHLLVAGQNDFDAILYKINDKGDTLWTKKYSGDTLHLFRPYQIISGDNNNYYLLIRTLDFNNNTPDIMRGTIIKIDSVGSEQWRNEYIATGFEQNADAQLIEEGNNLVVTGIKADGNYLIHYSYQLQTQIRRIDSTGNILQEYISDSGRWIGMWDGLKTQDGGFAFCGVEGTQLDIGGGPHMIYRGYVAKVDSNLQLVWERGFGSPDNTMYLKDMEELPDGSLILTGRRDVYYPSDAHYTVADSGYGGGWILKMSAEGDSLWQRIHRNGSFYRNYLNDIEILPDGGFIAAGYSEMNFTNHPDFYYQGWLIRTDSLGCIVPGCQLLDNTENVAVIFDNDVVVYPNPASEVVRFRFEKAIEKDTEIRVYSGLGQLVDETTVDYLEQVEMNVSDWQSSVYHYGIYVEGRLVKQGQILVQH